MKEDSGLRFSMHELAGRDNIAEVSFPPFLPSRHPWHVLTAVIDVALKRGFTQNS